MRGSAWCPQSSRPLLAVTARNLEAHVYPAAPGARCSASKQRNSLERRFMTTDQDAGQVPDEKVVRLFRPSVVVLCGPAGCGKSTFAARHFRPTQIISSDHCRALV